MNPMDLKRGIDLAVEKVVENIKSASKDVQGSSEIAQVGIISSNGDREVGEKIAEAMDYVLELAPRHAFATHEQVLSEAGRSLGHDRLGWAVREGGGEYHVLEPGDVLEL